jgi:hypothetical protein
MATEFLNSEAREAGFDDTPSNGVFLMRGQSLDLSSFTISIADDGEISATTPTLSTSTHMAPYWLRAAIGHARDAHRLAAATNQAFRTTDSLVQTRCLSAELTASMQAIACSAFAIDALHASLLKVAPTASATKEAWRKNRTKRSRQIFETIRVNFKLHPQVSTRVKVFLDQLTTARDIAVHPPSRSMPAQKHARLPVSMDPAFNTFRARNALVCVGLTVSLVEQLSEAKTVKKAKVAERMASLHELVTPLSRRWQRTSAGKAFLDLQRRDSRAPDAAA